MNKLFLTPINIEKRAAYHQLNRDATQWVKDIITKFLEDYPFLQNSPLTVSWNKKDITKGYALGSLRVLGGQVPLIIKDFALAPMDVVMFNGGLAIPLTESTLREMLSEPTPFAGAAAASPKSNLEMFGDGESGLQWSPVNTEGEVTNTSETSTTRDAVKVSSFIENISHIDKEAVLKIVNEIKNDPYILANYEKNGTLCVIEKLAKFAGDASNEVEAYVRGLDIDRQYVFSDELGNYHIKQANSAVDYTWTVDLSPEEVDTVTEKLAACGSPAKKAKKSLKKANAYKILDKKAYLYVDESKNYAILDENLLKNATVSLEIDSDVPKIGDIGVWQLGDTVTSPFEVISIAKNAEFEKANLYKLANRTGSLYINDKGDWCVRDKEIEKTANLHELSGCDPKVGDFGFFAVNENATVPFEIIGMQKLSGVGAWKIDTFDGLSKTSYYPLRVNGVITTHDTEKNAFYVPGNSKFVKLDQKLSKKSDFGIINKVTETGLVEIVGYNGLDKQSYLLTREEYEKLEPKLAKKAYYVPKNANFIKLSEKIDILENNLVEKRATASVLRDNAGFYNLSGNEITKYAMNHSVRNLDLDSAVWALVHMGANKEEIQKIASLKKAETTKIASNLKCPVNPKMLLGGIKANYADRAVKIASLVKNLVKEASVINNELTVDAVLSLGLITKYNIAEYLVLIPEYEKIMAELAKLLVMTRLGVTQMPEEYISKAMLSLTDVVGILRGIKASLNKH